MYRITDSGIQVLMGRRKNSHGEGQWSFPGGHLEYMESFQQAAERELAEEVGPQFIVTNWQTIAIFNMVSYAPRHTINIIMASNHVSGEPVLMEPEKCSEWEWFNIDNIPFPRYANIEYIVEALKSFNSTGTKIYDQVV